MTFSRTGEEPARTPALPARLVEKREDWRGGFLGIVAIGLVVLNSTSMAADRAAGRGERLGVEVEYLGSSEGKSVARITLTAAAPSDIAMRVLPAGRISVKLEGRVLDFAGNLIEAFSYPLEIDWRGVGETPPFRFGFLRRLTPGRVRMQLRAVSSDGTAWLTRSVDLAVPRLAVAFILPESGEGVLPDPEEVLAAPLSVISETPAVRLLPPLREMPLGPLRVQVQVIDDVHRVEFYLDGKLVTAAGRAPYTVDIDLGSQARTRTLAVRAYSPKGILLGEDAYVINEDENPLAVRLLVSRANRTGTRMRVRVAVQTQPGLPVERVELKLGNTTLVEWPAPPYELTIETAKLEAGAILEATAHARQARGFLGRELTAAADAPDEPPDESRDEIVASDYWLASGERFAQSVTVRLVELPVGVTDGRGHPIDGLGRDDFRVFEDERPQHLESFALAAKSRLALGLLVDSSGSMKSAIGEVRAAGSGFLTRLLQPDDIAFLLEFNDRASLLVAPTTQIPPLNLTRALLSIAPAGKTALYDAIVLGIYQFRHIPGHKALVVLTDGDDTASKVSYPDLRRYVRTAGVPVYILGLQIPFLRRGTKDRLRQLAEDSGGDFYPLRNPAGLAAFYSGLETELRARYFLTYRSDSPRTNAGHRAIRVEVARPGARVKTLSGYYGEGSEP